MHLRRLKLRHLLATIVASMLLSSTGFLAPALAANEPCRELLTAHWDTLDAIGESAYVNPEIPQMFMKKGGACGLDCAVNLLQGIRVSAGLGPLSNPNKVAVDMLFEKPILTEHGATIQTLHETTELLLLQNFDGRDAILDTTFLDLSHSGINWAGDVQIVTGITKEDIQVSDQIFKILFFKMFNKEKKELGGHYVIVKSIDENFLTAIDPNHPNEPMHYRWVVGHINNLPTIELRPEKDTFWNEIYGETPFMQTIGVVSVTLIPDL